MKRSPSDLTFRVFVSSTFSDLTAERDALQAHVFPRLQEFCRKRGAQFQAIDLRWGITEAAAQDQSTMRICRAEIVRCQKVTPKPNFIILLGDRYGWRPLPDEIPAAEFESLLPHLPRDLAERWYRLDENAVCPLSDGAGPDKGKYILQPKPDTPEVHERWFHEIERPLGDAMRRAALAAGLPEKERLKYEGSATAQEIYQGALSMPDAAEHVFAFVREICTRDMRRLQESLPTDAALKSFADFNFGTYELDQESHDQLESLKRRLVDRLGPERVKLYRAQWLGHGISTEHISRLCVDVFRSLVRSISAGIKSHGTLSPLEEEKHHHQAFAEKRVRDFTGQTKALTAIEGYLSPTSEKTLPLVIHGTSGSGKSALIAKVVSQLAFLQGHPRPIYRFIGATATSTNLRQLLESLCRELGERYEADNDDLPQDLHELAALFRQRLNLASNERPLILILDALDQIHFSGQPEIFWLPEQLPSPVRLIVSTTPGPVLDELQAGASTAWALELGPMVPDDAAELFEKWLSRSGRRLVPEAQRNLVHAAISQCSLPLYLRLAFEEVQRWRSYHHPSPLSPSEDGLIVRLFRQLSEQLHHEPLLVERAISFLRSSRFGLTENEVLELLAADDAYWGQFLASAHHSLPASPEPATRRLPIVIWSRLYHDLEPYLSWSSADGTSLLVFFHSRFNVVADQEFLPSAEVRCARHNALATYFRGLADPSRNDTWTGVEQRPFQQLPYHLRLSLRLDELSNMLTSVAYLDSRVIASDLLRLLSDFAEQAEIETDAMAVWRSFILANASALHTVPSLLPSLAWYETAPEIQRSAQEYLCLPRHRHPWLKLDRLPPLLAPNQKTDHASVPYALEILASCDDIKTNVAAIATERGLGFILKSLGAIGIIDFENGLQFPHSIPFSSIGRPLTMAACADGARLALVDETGKGICVELRWNQMEISAPAVVSQEPFTCFLPEIADPIVLLAHNRLWWQNESGSLVSWEFGCRQPHEILRLEGELRCLCATSDEVIALDVGRHRCSVLILNEDASIHRRIQAPAHTERLCLTPAQGLLVQTTEGATYLLEPNDSDTWHNGPDVPGIVTTMAPLQEGIFFELTGRCIFWSGLPADAPTPFTPPKFGAGRLLALGLTNNEVYGIKPVSAFRAKKHQSSPVAWPPGMSVCGLCPLPESNHYVALVQSQSVLYSLGTEAKDPLELGDAQTAALRAVTASGQMVWANGPSRIAIWTPPQAPTVKRIPGVGTIHYMAAGETGDYWLINEGNQIWWLDAEGEGRCLASVDDLNRPAPHHLLVSSEWVIWCGTSMGNAHRHSADHLDTVVFFRISEERSNRTLRRVGCHFFAQENGRWTMALFDNHSQQLSCFFQMLGEKKYFVRTGSPSVFLNDNERVVNLEIPEKLARDMRAGVCIANGKSWLIVTRAGWFIALEPLTFNLLGAYPAGVLGDIAAMADSLENCLVTLNGNEVARCSLVLGTRIQHEGLP